MKPSNILLYISCGIFIVVGFPAAADSQFKHRRSELSSPQQWKRSHDNRSSHQFNYKSQQRESSPHQSKQRSESRQSFRRLDSRSDDNRKFNTWKRRQRSEHSHSESHGATERRQKWPDNQTKANQQPRRSPPQAGKAPPSQQERSKARPEMRHQDRGAIPKPKPDFDHARSRHDKPSRTHNADRRDTRPNKHQHKRHDDRNEHRHKPYYPVRNEHRHYNKPHHPRPKYRLHKRHKYIYYRTPWYNTWFLAPLLWHYPHIGYTLEILPTPYFRIVVGGLPYFYARGTFYRPYGGGYVVVSAPIGAVVTTLPSGYIAFSIGLNTYYFANDIYYVWDEPRDGFVVVPKPDGAEAAIDEATQGRLYVYPNEGQSEEQQAKDRYECHRWAVTESDVDPTLEEQDYSDGEKREYKRAIAACLEGRGYTVK